ncbi:MAG TPA: hypothetical protein VK428_06065 [Acidimicrobiales bacterium]|nr:hypothetical protein [Acidimicrobiales bacterium]
MGRVRLGAGLTLGGMVVDKVVLRYRSVPGVLGHRRRRVALVERYTTGRGSAP